MKNQKNCLNTNESVELEGRVMLSAATTETGNESPAAQPTDAGVSTDDSMASEQASSEAGDRDDRREVRREERNVEREARREIRRAERDVEREARREIRRAERDVEREARRETRRAERDVEREARREIRGLERAFERSEQSDLRDANRSDAEPIILGGTNDLGGFVDPINADFTRQDGSLPLTSFNVENLGPTEDGKVRVRVTQTNLAAENGVFLTPTFVAIQDGTYDLYDRGGQASPGLESLAEDGAVEGVIAQFDASGAIGATGVISGSESGDPTPLAPGASGSVELEIDPADARFLMFAQMVLPSNDAFVASPGDPRGIELFDAEGNFTGGEIVLTGNDVLDAGTEINTELDAAFINQTAPNTGETEGGVIRQHVGFIGSERFRGVSN